MTTANLTRTDSAPQSQTAVKPCYPQIDADKVPAEMREERRWITWRSEDGRKAPNCKWTDAENWQTFDDAAANATQRKCGIGFVLGDGWVGLDWDHLDTKQREAAEAIIATLNCYRETSVSGDGLHAITRVTAETTEQLATISAGKADFEFYPGGRWFTVSTTDAQCNGIDGSDAEVLRVFHDHKPSEKTRIVAEHRKSTELIPEERTAEVIEAVRHKLRSFPESIDGSGGSDQTVKAVRLAVTGFGLFDRVDVLDAMTEYNETRCIPPWDTETETGANSLLRKIDDVLSDPNRETSVIPLAALHTAFPGDSFEKAYREELGPDWRDILNQQQEEKRAEQETQQDAKRREQPTFAGDTLDSIWGMADDPVDWLVDGLIDADEPTVFGARKKSLKTTWLMDLSIALATAGTFLGKWTVPKRRRVLLITGESNKRSVARRFKKAMAARTGLRLEHIGDWLRIEAIDFPKLPSLEDRMAITKTIKDHDIDVVIVEPLYRGMTGDVESANLFSMGGVLGDFKDACKPASLIISHHFKKSTSHNRQLPDIDDLSQSGIAEFAGNYVLFNRLERYTGDGKHEMAFTFGGRAEQCGDLHISFDEHEWKAEIEDWADYERRAEVDRVLRVEKKRTEKESRILDALRGDTEGLTTSALARACGSKPDTKVFMAALKSVVADGLIERVAKLKHRNGIAEGYRLADCEDSPVA